MIKCSICNNDTSNKEVCSECGNKMKTLIVKARKKWRQLKLNMGESYNGNYNISLEDKEIDGNGRG